MLKYCFRYLLYDRSACTLAIAESAPGLRIGRDQESLQGVVRHSNSAIFFPSFTFAQAIGSNEFSPAWHDVVQKSQYVHSADVACWSIILFADVIQGTEISYKDTHIIGGSIKCRSKRGLPPDILIGPSVLEQKDVDVVNKLRRQLALSSEESAGVIDLSKDKLTDILCQPNCRMIFFKDPNTDEVIGMASLYYHQTLYEPDGVGRVENVVINERYRGQSLGRLLMRFIFATARNLRLKTLELTSNPKRVEANKMYLELGFKKYDTNCYIVDL